VKNNSEKVTFCLKQKTFIKCEETKIDKNGFYQLCAKLKILEKKEN